MQIDLTFASGIFANYCFTSYQELAVDLVNGISAEIAGEAALWNIGTATPGPDDRDKPWFRFNADGTPDKIYSYVNGAWISRHPLVSPAVIMFTGSEADITTYDGGEAGAITATTGPMWEKLSSMDARFPIGPGTLPSGDVIAVGDQGGEEEVELEEENIPLHEIQGYALATGANLGTNAAISDDDRVTNPTTLDSFGGDEDGATVAHNNIPPYTGIFFIRRTARTHYRI